MDFIKTINRTVENAAIIAEDLGMLTPAVHRLLKSSGYPGMKVLQFAFDSREESDYLPHNYTRNCVVYTGTHDNDTILGWYKSLPGEDRRLCDDYLNLYHCLKEEEPDKSAAWELIRAALASVASLAVIPMQDYLGLDSRARINTPSTIGDNWKWRMKDGDFTEELAEKIKEMTRLYGRLGA